MIRNEVCINITLQNDTELEYDSLQKQKTNTLANSGCLITDRTKSILVGRPLILVRARAASSLAAAAVRSGAQTTTFKKISYSALNIYVFNEVF